MRKGFTLVEILVAMGLVGLLMGAGMGTFSRTSRIQALEGSADQLRQAFQLAKSNALAGKKDCTVGGVCGCTNASTDKPLAGWSVEVNATTRQFSVNGFCGENADVGATSGSNKNTKFTNNGWTSLNLNPAAIFSVSPLYVTRIGFRPITGMVVTSGGMPPIVYTLRDQGVTWTVTITTDGNVVLRKI